MDAKNSLISLQNVGPVYPGPSDEDRTQQSLAMYKFNEFYSRSVPFQRAVPDMLSEQCKQKQYSLDILLETSVIICFYNEAWSSLLRTVSLS